MVHYDPYNKEGRLLEFDHFSVIDHSPPWCLNICGSFVECKQRPDRRTLFLRVEMHDAYGIAYDSCLKPVDVP